jgi:hypothetical protein
MFMSALILVLVAGVFTIVGAVIQRWQPNPKRLDIEKSRTTNITSALEVSGLNIKLTQAGKKVQNIYQSHFAAKNTGKLGLKDVEVVVSVPVGAKILNIFPVSDSVALVKSFSSKDAGLNSQVCTIGHINPEEEFNLIAYSSVSGATFECRQTDFSVFKMEFLGQRELKGFRGFVYFVKGNPLTVFIALITITAQAVLIVSKFFVTEKLP